MLLWFKDLINVTNEVTVHRHNVSTLLSSALIRGDLNAATRGPFIRSLISFKKPPGCHMNFNISPFLFQQCSETNTHMQAGISQLYNTKIIPAHFYAKHVFSFAERSSLLWLQEIHQSYRQRFINYNSRLPFLARCDV